MPGACDADTTTEPLLVILNPAAGAARAARRGADLQRELHRAKVPFALATTRGPGHARELAAAAAGGVVVVGGDGTVHEVINGLSPRGGVLGPIAVCPAGRGDDFAASAGFPRSPSELAARLRARPSTAATRAVDVGCAQLECEHGLLERRFANDAGLGFEAEVILATAGLGALRGRWLYSIATLRALLRQRPFECDIAWDIEHAAARNGQGERAYDGDDGDGSSAELEADGAPSVHPSLLLVSACNGRRIGGGLPMAPAARLDDRRLDAVCVASRSRLHTAILLARLARGRHLRDPGVRVVRCRSATFRPRRPIPVALDGEVIARQATLVRLAMAPEPLALLGG